MLARPACREHAGTCCTSALRRRSVERSSNSFHPCNGTRYSRPSSPRDSRARLYSFHTRWCSTHRGQARERTYSSKIPPTPRRSRRDSLCKPKPQRPRTSRDFLPSRQQSSCMRSKTLLPSRSSTSQPRSSCTHGRPGRRLPVGRSWRCTSRSTTPPSNRSRHRRCGSRPKARPTRTFPRDNHDSRRSCLPRLPRIAPQRSTSTRWRRARPTSRQRQTRRTRGPRTRSFVSP